MPAPVALRFLHVIWPTRRLKLPVHREFDRVSRLHEINGDAGQLCKSQAFLTVDVDVCVCHMGVVNHSFDIRFDVIYKKVAGEHIQRMKSGERYL